MEINLFEGEFTTKSGSRAVIRITGSEGGPPWIELTFLDRQERPGPFAGALTAQSDGTMRFEAGSRRNSICVSIPVAVATEIGTVLQTHRDRSAAALRASVVEGFARSARETTPDPTFGLEEWMEGRGM